MRFGTSRDVRLTGALTAAAHPDQQYRVTAMLRIGRPATDPDLSRLRRDILIVAEGYL